MVFTIYITAVMTPNREDDFDLVAKFISGLATFVGVGRDIWGSIIIFGE